MRGRGRRRVRLGVARRRRVGGGRAHRGRVEFRPRGYRVGPRGAREGNHRVPRRSTTRHAPRAAQRKPRVASRRSRSTRDVVRVARRARHDLARAAVVRQDGDSIEPSVTLLPGASHRGLRAAALARRCSPAGGNRARRRGPRGGVRVRGGATRRANPRGRGGTRLRGTPFRDDVGRRAVGGVDQGRGAHDARRGGTHDRRQRRRRRARARRVPILRVVASPRAAENGRVRTPRGVMRRRGGSIGRVVGRDVVAIARRGVATRARSRGGGTVSRNGDARHVRGAVRQRGGATTPGRGRTRALRTRVGALHALHVANQKVRGRRRAQTTPRRARARRKRDVGRRRKWIGRESDRSPGKATDAPESDANRFPVRLRRRPGVSVARVGRADRRGAQRTYPRE